MNIKIENIDTVEECEPLTGFLDRQIKRLVVLEPGVLCSEVGRLSSIHPLYSSIIEDCISVRVLENVGSIKPTF